MCVCVGSTDFTLVYCLPEWSATLCFAALLLEGLYLQQFIFQRGLHLLLPRAFNFYHCLFNLNFSAWEGPDQVSDLNLNVWPMNFQGRLKKKEKNSSLHFLLASLYEVLDSNSLNSIFLI